ncbi:MAG: type III pantothenate kinase [Candidatus Omnitrophica bacterium]|nr:type III pantothenate kinase [Candidatus Omnitrophota bacterium]
MKNIHNLLITIDLGNSSTSYGVFKGRKLIDTGYLNSYNIPLLTSKIMRYSRYNPNISVIISSVVPILCNKLIKSLRKITPKISIYLIGKEVRPKVQMKYDPKLLGSDRLVNIYGAVRRYRLPLLLIDYGTAITFDYVSKRGIFEGGLIVPGIEISRKALQVSTALLPKIKVITDSPQGLAARNTKAAMVLGLLNGFGALSDGLIERFKTKYGKNLMVIATGGFAKNIAVYAHKLDYVDPLHTLRSLELIYQNEIREA